MKTIREILTGLSYDDIKAIFGKHLDWSVENNRVSGKPRWWDKPNSLNVISIRCNTETDFNFGKYNDLALIIYNTPDGSYIREVIEVTVDPCRNKDGIAHLRQGMWNSYIIGVHGISGPTGGEESFPGIGKQKRWCLRQNGEVEIVRTNGKGVIIKTERGNFYIDFHDSAGYKDSSLACTIVHLIKDYLSQFFPYLFDIKTGNRVPENKDDITYCLINQINFEQYYGEQLEREKRAWAVDGVDIWVQGEQPHKATRIE